MILKNKLTHETLDIPYSEFRIKFAKEIQDAFESYRKTQLNKYSWNFKDDNSLEFNFCQNFQKLPTKYVKLAILYVKILDT